MSSQGKEIFTDGSDDLFTKGGYRIEIYHVPSGGTVKFKAWVTSFSDSYQSNWNTEDVYGRMDPISTFQNTRRTISLSWDVVSISEDEAKNNMKKCEKLFRMLYPSYEAPGDNASNIRQAPLFKIKFGNLISGAKSPGGASVVNGGLLGTMSGFEYAPDFESGFFTPGRATMYPQMISLNAEFQVLHNFPLGWKEKKFRTEGFPYGNKSVVKEPTGTPDEKKEEPKEDPPGTSVAENVLQASLPRGTGVGESGQTTSGGQPYMSMEQSTEPNQSVQPEPKPEPVTQEAHDKMMNPCDPNTQSCP
jgi:hypothetical protein